MHLLTADLTNPAVRIEALSAGSVAAIDEPSAMARKAGAVAVVNGDYFNQNDLYKTNAPVGPVTIDVVNQYGIPVNGVGLYTSEWGDTVPDRGMCGDENNDRMEPCDLTVWQVRVNEGKVTTSAAVNRAALAGVKGDDNFSLVARGKGIDRIKGLVRGDQVTVNWGLLSAGPHDYRDAIGGFPIAVDGSPVPGVVVDCPNERTAVGVDARQTKLFMAVVDRAGPEDNSKKCAKIPELPGATLPDMAKILLDRGASDVFSFDSRSRTAARPGTRSQPWTGAWRTTEVDDPGERGQGGGTTAGLRRLHGHRPAQPVHLLPPHLVGCLRSRRRRHRHGLRRAA